jgi:2-polyprenyl-3-methyl-5-hydroxy-6-metoxy-1,4-benzoquinol methylase
MATYKQRIVKILRQLRLLQIIDHVLFLINLKNNQTSNKAFIENHPDFQLPSPELAYDAYGHTNWDAYYQTGIEHAQYISNLIKTNINSRSLTIGEWGCGPARILRQIPQFFQDRSVSLYGFDYNNQTILWCQKHIENITFKHNLLTPPLTQSANSFDCLYCVSVFTHLSRKMHFEWIKELSRVVKPDGIIILTTHGDLTKSNLLKQELFSYEHGELVVRDKVEEGKRTFVAYHPPSFVEDELLKGLTVISHIINPIPHNLTQDIWVVRNTNNQNL